jgi:hypothetical protein
MWITISDGTLKLLMHWVKYVVWIEPRMGNSFHVGETVESEVMSHLFFTLVVALIPPSVLL